MKKKLIVCILLICICICSAFVIENPDLDSAYIGAKTIYNINMKQDILCLMMAYPEYIEDIQKTQDGKVYLIMKSGNKILYDDKRTKSIDEKITNPDLQDMLEQIYPLKPVTRLMDKSFDPGRARVYSLLNEVYGGSKTQIEKNLKNVKVGYKNYSFNQNNNAAESLKKAMQELVPLAQRNQRVAGCMYPCSGTYNYRYISGTNRLSPHSFGIAIDLSRDKRDYWKWASREEGQKRLTSYPTELVEVLERYNFVWGGKWGHFDILHFEYRPEIILKARCFGEKDASSELWYKNAPIDDEKIKGYINRIDEIL